MKKKKLWMIIGIIFIIAVIVALTALYLEDRSKYVYKIEKVTEINYNVINQDNRYGVIDRKGNIVVEPIYDIIQIPNPSKPIFICMSNYDTEKRKYDTKVFNEKGEELYPGYESIQAIPNETAEGIIPFEKTVLQYQKDGKYGLLNMNGKEVTKPEYDQITSIAYKEGMFLVEQNEKFGVINMNGKTVIDIEYDSITADNYYSEKTKYQTTGFIVSQKKPDGYKYGYINYKGHKVLETEYTEIERVTEIKDDKNIYVVALKDGQAGLLKNKKVILNHEYEDISYNAYNDVFVVQRNGKQGIVDRNGKLKINPEYDNILFGGIYINAKKEGEVYVLDLNGNQVPEENVISKIPSQDGKHFIISDQNEIYKITDEQGNVIIDKQYSYIEEIYNNYYIVANKEKNGIIDLTGKSMLELQYNSIYKIDGTNLLEAYIPETKTIALIDKNMKVIASMDDAGIEINEGYVHLYTETENKYVDFDGNILTYQQINPNLPLYAKQINGKWGFVDQNGNIKVQNEYEMVTELNEYGYAGIKQDGKWGIIDETGTIVQEPIYELNWANPKFIGKYYKEVEWYGDLYYTDKQER